MRLRILLLPAALAVVLAGCGADRAPEASAPKRATGSCADHATQAAAQRAADTRDGNRDGIYCNDLPCPCAGPGAAERERAAGRPAEPPSTPTTPRACSTPADVQIIGFSKTKYPNIYRHFQDAVAEGWPQILVVNRARATARRERLLARTEPRPGRDRDEYPPAVGRGTGRPSLMQGQAPRGWKASVAHVPSAENASHGSTLGLKLRRFCDGTRFRYGFY